jgi:hypothetical protein
MEDSLRIYAVYRYKFKMYRFTSVLKVNVFVKSTLSWFGLVDRVESSSHLFGNCFFFKQSLIERGF